MPRAQIDFYVLDALADGHDEATHISVRVSRWDPSVIPSLQTSLMRLVQQGLIEACVYHPTDPELVPVGVGTWPVGPWQDNWYRSTPQGLMVHSVWEPDGDGQAI